jgi:hypothetical protein
MFLCPIRKLLVKRRGMFKIGAGKKKGVITPLILLPCKRLGFFSPGVKINYHSEKFSSSSGECAPL